MSDDFWEKERKYRASIPAMSRAEYLRKYPNGGPTRYSGPGRGPKYEEFVGAVKRRDMEGRRGGWNKFWWYMAALAVTFVLVTIFQSWQMGLFAVFILVLMWCFVEMGMNLPSR